MKRSDCNELLKARLEFSMEYYAVGTKEDDTEEYFSRSGCDICPHGLAGSVFEVTYLAHDNTDKADKDVLYEGEICGGCLCSLVNGDDTDLDYYCDDEDEPELSPDEAVAEIKAEKADKPTQKDIDLEKDLSVFLAQLKAYQNYSISFDGDGKDRTITELWDRFDSLSDGDERREMRRHLAENKMAKIMELLTYSSFDFYFDNSDEG